MNRCPSCRDCLRFVGIRAPSSATTAWERWSLSPICGLYVVTDEYGATTAVTREEPKKGYFNGERAS